MLDCNLDHGAEVVIILAADGHVAGVDAVLRKGLGAIRILGQQQMSVVVEVADDGRVPALLRDALDDVRQRLCRFIVVHSDAHHLRAGARKCRDLLNGAFDVCGVGVRHRLNDDRRIGADADAPDLDGNSFAANDLGHEDLTCSLPKHRLHYREVAR